MKSVWYINIIILLAIVFVWTISLYSQFDYPITDMVVVKHTTGVVKEARITCYAPTGNKMANNQYPKYGYVAVSDYTIPFGTKILIDNEEFIVGDRTARWVGEKFDILTIDKFLETGCDINFGAKIKKVIIYK